MSNDKNHDDNTEDTEESAKTPWHDLFTTVLQEWLAPVGIEVLPEVCLTTKPQRADCILLKNNDEPFTPEQLFRLADGLRDSHAQRLILEFKYTESFHKDFIRQTMGYEATYRKQQHMTEAQVDSFLLCSQSPRAATLRNFGYTVTEHQGVYRNSHPVLADTLIISLNDLSNEPHNIPLKVFASKLREKQNVDAIDNNALRGMSPDLELTLEGLQEILFDKGEKYMANVESLTPEYVKEIGRRKIDHILSIMPADEVLKRYGAEELAKRLKPEERLKGLTVKDRLIGLSDKEIQELKDELNKK